MPIAWFIAPYKTKSTVSGLYRYCAMDDFTQQIIYADGGNWSESEILGNVAVVKVKAAQTTLDTISSTVNFVKLPKVLLTESLSDLTPTQKTAILNKLTSLGYSVPEIKNALGDDIGSKTLADLLRFAATRRLKPHFNADQTQILVDGIEQRCRPIEDVDKTVK